MSPGQFSLEIGMGDWTLSKDDTQRQDIFVIGDALLRYGVTEHAELQVGWSALGLSRIRDRASGEVTHHSGTGDVTVAFRRNLANPDGAGLSLALMPYVSLPTGHREFGSGDWGGGVLMPASYQISDQWSIAATTEIDAAVDGDGHGRHLAVSETVGASLALGETLSASAEYQVLADRDPSGHTVQHLSGLSLAWQARENLQFDLGANAGLDPDADDLEIYVGVSRRF